MTKSEDFFAVGNSSVELPADFGRKSNKGLLSLIMWSLAMAHTHTHTS